MKRFLILLSIVWLATCGGGGDSPTEPTPPQLPTVQNIEFTIAEDTAYTFAFTGTDPLNQALTYSMSTQPQHGTISINAGAGTYTPNANYNGSDSFAYLATSINGNSNIGTIVATITPVDDEPSTLDVSVTTDEDNDINIEFDLTEVDGDNVVFSVTNNPSNGSVTISGNNALYSPNSNWHGTDQFNFQVEDTSARKILNTATATIVVNSVNDEPVANNITETMDENRYTSFQQPLSITLDASDADGDDLTYIIESDVSNGSLQSDGTSSVIYTPNQDYNGVDTFTYKVNDGYDDSNIATVTININSVEDIPIYDGEVFDWYFTFEYGIQDTFKFTLPVVDGDGDNITWYMDRDDSPFSFNDDQSEFFALGANLSYASSFEVGIYGIDDKGNQGSTGILTLNIYGGPQGLSSVEEYTAGYLENNEQRDPGVSYVPWNSLGSTGYIIENRAGEVNVAPYTRDFDRFNYWTEPSQFHIELDFSQESLAWDYLTETVNGYVPFTAYLIDAFDNSKEQLFAGYWDYDGDGTFNLGGFSGHSSGGVGPVWGALAWEPIYLFLPQDGVVYGDEAQYVIDNVLETSGGIGYASSNGRELRSSLDFGNPPTVTYPIMTATLFTDYLGSGVLPTEEGHESWGSGYDSASSVVFKTSFEIYDTPQGNDDDSSKQLNLRKSTNTIISKIIEPIQ